MRLGICGGGPWTDQVHLPAAIEHPRIELAGLWCRRPEVATKLATAAGVPEVVVADLDDLIDRSDAVAFVVPPEAQPALAARAIEAGKHVVLEKPIAAGHAGAKELARQVEDAGVSSLVCFTRRWVPEYAAWLDRQELLAGHRGGEVTMLSSALTTASGFENSEWRHARGGLWDMGPHALSLLIKLLGQVEHVQGVTGAWGEAHLVLGHVSGGISTVQVGISCPPRVNLEEFRFLRGEGVVSPPFSLAMTGERVMSAQFAMLDALLDMVSRGETRHPLDVHFGERVVAVLETAERALSTGCREKVQ